MNEIISKLSGYAALVGVIGAIGGGFMAWGQFNNRIAQLEDKEYVVNQEVDLTDINKEIERLKADIKINSKALEYLDSKLEELKVSTNNPLLNQGGICSVNIAIIIAIAILNVLYASVSTANTMHLMNFTKDQKKTQELL